MKLKKFDSINVVPMIDIMLVLLVIVLTTATFIAKGIIPLKLPKATSATDMKKSKKIDISISQNGEIYIDKQKSSIDKIDTILKNRDKNSSIFISCDKRVRYNSFVLVLDKLKESGFNKINIVTTK